MVTMPSAMRLMGRGKIVTSMSSPHLDAPPAFHSPFQLPSATISDDLEESQIASSTLLVAILPVVAAALFLPNTALADAGQYGVLAGRTASMLHPITNFALFATSLYSAYLGLQWRHLRGLSEEIKDLNKQLPVLASTEPKFPLSDIKDAIKKELKVLQDHKEENAHSGKITALKNDLRLLEAAQPLDEKYRQLTQERKSLQQANLKDKHHNTGAILLGAGVSVSILGAFNTYMRAGKLFPGPHLYAGMAITILWAVAASLVPAMQKGNEAARIAHIGLNIINIALFAWQIPTGVEIMLKVWEKTSW
eukprot:gene5308-5843_t